MYLYVRKNSAHLQYTSTEARSVRKCSWAICTSSHRPCFPPWGSSVCLDAPHRPGVSRVSKYSCLDTLGLSSCSLDTQRIRSSRSGLLWVLPWCWWCCPRRIFAQLRLDRRFLRIRAPSAFWKRIDVFWANQKGRKGNIWQSCKYQLWKGKSRNETQMFLFRNSVYRYLISPYCFKSQDI